MAGSLCGTVCFSGTLAAQWLSFSMKNWVAQQHRVSEKHWAVFDKTL
jgi:hypothetical protein